MEIFKTLINKIFKINEIPTLKSFTLPDIKEYVKFLIERDLSLAPVILAVCHDTIEVIYVEPLLNPNTQEDTFLAIYTNMIKTIRENQTRKLFFISITNFISINESSDINMEKEVEKTLPNYAYMIEELTREQSTVFIQQIEYIENKTKIIPKDKPIIVKTKRTATNILEEVQDMLHYIV